MPIAHISFDGRHLIKEGRPLDPRLGPWLPLVTVNPEEQNKQENAELTLMAHRIELASLRAQLRQADEVNKSHTDYIAEMTRTLIETKTELDRLKQVRYSPKVILPQWRDSEEDPPPLGLTLIGRWVREGDDDELGFCRLEQDHFGNTSWNDPQVGELAEGPTCWMPCPSLPLDKETPF